MEEYFPPIGTDHQIILDERQDRFGFLRRPPLLWGILITLLIVVFGSWYWQRHTSFNVPATVLSANVTRVGQSWLATSNPFALPSGWTAPTHSRFAITAGGDFTHIQWIIVPRWISLPKTFRTQETHGLYRLAVTSDAPERTQKLSLQEAHSWLRTAPHALGAVRLTDTSSAQPTLIAWNDTFAVSSSPYPDGPWDLSETDDASYALQQTALDESFLQQLVINNQGLAPWRKDLSRISWTDTANGRSWELVTKTATATQALTSTSTYVQRETIDDGTLLLVDHVTVPTSSAATSRIGIPEGSATSTCAEGKFHPFLRMRGATLQQLPHTIVSSSTALEIFEVGSIDHRFAICFHAKPRVDK
ncbi:hypothetical protein KBB27_02460 [Patescibacteria group bacterium]|nr:hypothetical protein [Patescibacteria group bacterium]